MFLFEQIALVYFTGLAGVALLGPWGARRRLRGGIWGLAAVGAVLIAVSADGPVFRWWLGHLYLVLGYWIPAVFTPRSPPGRFEQWLASADRALIRQLPTWRMPARIRRVYRTRPGLRTPSRIRQWLELAYLSVFPFVPITFAVVAMRGTAGDAERFWAAVLLAGFACYGTLPWMTARPPRMAAPDSEALAGVRRVNAWVLGRVSHQLNTFPSGHVAVAVAATLGVCGVSRLAGTVSAVVALGIAVAAVTGRYHFFIDVVLGGIVGVLAWTII